MHIRREGTVALTYHLNALLHGPFERCGPEYGEPILLHRQATVSKAVRELGRWLCLLWPSGYSGVNALCPRWAGTSACSTVLMMTL